MKDWGDAKRWIFEDLVIYGAAFILAIGWDYLVFVLSLAGFNVFTHEGAAHPINFGAFQIFGITFSAFQFLRKIAAWRYYA